MKPQCLHRLTPISPCLLAIHHVHPHLAKTHPGGTLTTCTRIAYIVVREEHSIFYDILWVSGFTLGEYEAARFFVACLASHSRDDVFYAEDIGFVFTDLANVPCGISDQDVPVSTRDFIRAAIRIMQGHIKNISDLSGMDSEEIISRLGIAVAGEFPDDHSI